LSSIHAPKAQAKGPESGFPEKITTFNFDNLGKKTEIIDYRPDRPGGFDPAGGNHCNMLHNSCAKKTDLLFV
jgi:hypothetical protein